jgi:hypothetical protein
VLSSEVMSDVTLSIRVFSSEPVGENSLYCKFGIESEGAAILVRPDGYISMLAELSDAGAKKIITFLQDL